MKQDQNGQQKSAFIAIVGKPNVGKSSILNKLIGQKIAIVSKRPQTTRNRIMGVLTTGDCQYVFIDTPGLVKAKNPLGDYMVKSVTTSITGVDGCLLVTEATQKVTKADQDLMQRFQALGMPAVLAINKIDLLADKTALMEQIAAFSAAHPFDAVVPVSARNGDGLDALLTELNRFAKPGGFFFPEDTLTDQTERSIAGEIVREKLLRLLEKEIPHGTAAVTERMAERNGLLDIDVTIYCERTNHKGIIIGKGGGMLKKVGTQARQDMERFFACKVNLQLWVKVKEDWRQRRGALNEFGYQEKLLKDEA